MDQCKQNMFNALQEFSVTSTDYIKLLATWVKGLCQEISIALLSFMTYISRQKIVPTWAQ